jgi:hypothetical protein
MRLWDHLRMNPQDDPEARIRQLEQPLADYGAVELGATTSTGGAPPGPTAPLPPPVYGDPYTAPQPNHDPYTSPPLYGGPYLPVKRKGAPVGLIVGLIALAVVAIFGVIGAIVWTTVSHVQPELTRPGRSSVAGGGGSVGAPSVRVPSVAEPTNAPPIVLPGIPDLSGPTSAPAGAPLSIAGIDVTKNVTCNDNVVSVSGVNNTVTITGHCTSVTVSGMNNKVTVDSVDTIGASGFDNQVTYRSGAPHVDATDSNVVSQG